MWKLIFSLCVVMMLASTVGRAAANCEEPLETTPTQLASAFSRTLLISSTQTVAPEVTYDVQQHLRFPARSVDGKADEDEAYRAITTSVPFTPWRSLIDLIHWEGRESTYEAYELGARMYWGKPKNLPAGIEVWIGLIQVYGQVDEVSVELVVGPITEDREATIKIEDSVSHFLYTRFDTFRAPDGHIYWHVRPSPLSDKRLVFLREYIHRLQDLRFDGLALN